MVLFAVFVVYILLVVWFSGFALAWVACCGMVCVWICGVGVVLLFSFGLRLRLAVFGSLWWFLLFIVLVVSGVEV